MVNYSKNEKKVYFNKCLEIQEETFFEILKNEYNEINELIELFSYNANPDRIIELAKKKDIINNMFEQKLNKSKNKLFNTKKRLEYNFKKC